MKICITTISTTGNFTGIAFYLQKLIASLKVVDSENEYIVITTKDNFHFFDLSGSNFREIRLPFNQRTLFSRATLHLYNIVLFPFVLLFLKAQVVHYPNTMFVSRFPARVIITIHDIVDQKVNKYGKLRKLYRYYLVKRGLKYADEVITVSQNSKSDLLNLCRRSINMIYNGYDPIASTGSLDACDVLSKYGVKSGDYFITIGTLLKHKNIPRLIRVFAKYQESAGPSAIGNLLIVGHKENDYQNIVNEIASNSLEGKVKILNYVSNYDKLALLSRSFSFIYFSLYEGFGFPILEAQDLKVPVIILDTSCLQEIAGETALVIPNSKEDSVLVSKLIESEMKLKDRVSREKIIVSSKENLTRFDWIRSAEETRKLYMRYAS